MIGKPKIFANTSYQIAGRFFIVLVSLIITAILTRTLGVAVYGDYVFITSLVILFTGLSDFGASQIGVREASSNKDKMGEIFGSVLGLRIILSSLFFVIFIALSLIMPQFRNLTDISFWASFVILLIIFKTVSQAVFNTHFRFDLSSFLDVVSSLLFLIPLIITLIFNITLTLKIVIIFWLFSTLVSAAVGWYLSRRLIQLKTNFGYQKLKVLFKQTLPLGIYLLVYSLYDRGIDSIFLKTFCGSDAVGYYGLAYKIYGNLILGAAFLMNSLFPLISSFEKDSIEIKKYFNKAFCLLFTSAIGIFIIFYISSIPIIKIISGNNYLVSAQILKVLLLALIFSGLNHLTGYYMIILDEQSKLLRFSIIAFVFNITANYIFIPIYSYWAAAVVTIFTELIIFLFSFIYLRKKYNLTVNTKSYFDNLKLFIKYKRNYFENNT